MRRLSRSLVGGSAALAIGLTACGGPGVPADPSDAVAQGLDARLEDGFNYAVTFQLSDNGRESLVRDAGDEVADLFESGLTGAFQPPDRFSLAIGDDNPWIEIRQFSEELYLRVDLDAIAALTGEDLQLPSAPELQQQFQTMGISNEITQFALAALEGRWVGITGLSQEAIEGLGQMLGAPIPTPDPQASEDIRDALERAGLLDGEELTERYLIVTGADGAYEVEVKARALVTALTDVITDLEQYAQGFAPTDMPDPNDVPEQIGGITITLDGAKADLVTLDLVTIMSSFDPDAAAEEGLTEGDVRLVVDFDDLDASRVSVPEGATTMTFEALLQGLVPVFMGMFGGIDDMQY